MPHDDVTLDDLLRLIRRLRAPGGCPWDQEQTLRSVRAYLLEEAHEAAQAIDAGSAVELREELGDLLFQVAFVAVLAEERDDFTLGDSLRGVHRKMVDRHPHVFGDGSGEVPADAAAVARSWARRKAVEAVPGSSVLDGVPASLPALVAAYRLGQKAAGVGFDWPDLAPVVAKVREELAEVEAELADDGTVPPDRRRLEEEVGDLLFAVANLARHLELDPEAALALTNREFRRRFGRVETELRERGVGPGEATLDEMDALWDAAKNSPERW